MSTHLPGFQSFSAFLESFCIVKLATSSIRVKQILCISFLAFTQKVFLISILFLILTFSFPPRASVTMATVEVMTTSVGCCGDLQGRCLIRSATNISTPTGSPLATVGPPGITSPSPSAGKSKSSSRRPVKT